MQSLLSNRYHAASRHQAISFWAQGTLASGEATFTGKPADIPHDMLVVLGPKLTALGLAKGHQMPAVLPSGHLLLPPGAYKLEAIYPGGSSYAAAVATIPLTFLVDPYP